MEHPQADSDPPGAFTRRSLIAGAAGVSVAGAIVGRGATARADAPAVVPPYALPSGNYRVDLHTHFLPTEYATVAESHGLPIPPWSAAAQIAFMDAWGIDVSIVSLAAPIYFGDLGQTRDLARTVNEIGQGLLATHPDRYGVLVTLPLPDIDGSLTELAYALDTLKLDNGVLLLTHYNGVYLGDPSYEPLYQELDSRGCTVWVHPDFPPQSAAPFPGLGGLIVDYPFETTRAAANLISNDVLTTYPNITWQLSHVGGTLPFLLYRLGATYPIPFTNFPVGPEAKQSGPFVLAKQFYYDTAQANSTAQLSGAQEFVDPSHFVFGTDWPWTAGLFNPAAAQALPWFTDFLTIGNDPEPMLSQAFTRPQRLKVERDNGLGLYPGVAARL